jgi:hypothetical protein
MTNPDSFCHRNCFPLIYSGRGIAATDTLMCHGAQMETIFRGKTKTL